MSTDYDICVIGGGINGSGIARDAAGRGYNVLLVEAQDLASATSSASTKLVHGGLRYLEHYEFKLVRESLIEREVLLKSAPHVIWPMEFVLPHKSSVRPYWLIRLGLFLYDHLGGRKILQGSRGVKFRSDIYAKPLKALIRKGFAYFDCWVEDSRMVVLNAFDARRLGADVLTYTACTSLKADKDHGWRVDLQDMVGGNEFTVTAKSIINAAGPWVRDVLENSDITGQDNPAPKVRMVKGSHIITRKLFEGDHAYILQQPDKRIVFAIPYEEKFTLIGTTDVEFDGNPSQVSCSSDEIEYLCNAINIYFSDPISPADVLWTYSGVRPLLDDGKENSSKVTRDYRLETCMDYDAPLLSVFGGKITTFRTLSEHAVDEISEMLGTKSNGWTSTSHLPGGKIPPEKMNDFVEQQLNQYQWLPAQVVRRYAKHYGMRMNKILSHATSTDQLGRDFGDGIYEAELVYSIHYEFTKTADDFLWRRTKMGLHASQETLDRLYTGFSNLYESVKRYE